MGSYLRRNGVAIVRIYTGYEPLRVFSTMAVVLFALGVMAWMPFLWDWLANGESEGHLQSVILGAVFFLAAVQVFVLGFLADTIATHRAVSQRILERVARLELAADVEPKYYEHTRRRHLSEGPTFASRGGARSSMLLGRCRTTRYDPSGVMASVAEGPARRGADRTAIPGRTRSSRDHRAVAHPCSVHVS